VTQDLRGAESAELQGENVPPAETLGKLQKALRKKLGGGATDRAKRTICADKMRTKTLKKKGSCIPAYGYPERALQLLQRETFDISGPRPDSLLCHPDLVLGFDAEWVEVADKPEDEEDKIETPAHNNKILSYQIAARTSFGHQWAVIVFPRAGQAVLHPDMSEQDLEKIPERIRFADLIGIGISEGIRLGHLTRWPQKPITVAGHWTRTDLTAMADFAEIKSEFDGVHNTYVTANPLMGLYETATSIAKHRHELSIRLLDTWLLVPEDSKGLNTLGEIYNFPKLKVGKAPDGRNYIECMDQLLRDDPDLFKRYAIRDAEITTRHVPSGRAIVATPRVRQNRSCSV
jgi:hypothetical protein